MGDHFPARFSLHFTSWWYCGHGWSRPRSESPLPTNYPVRKPVKIMKQSLAVFVSFLLLWATAAASADAEPGPAPAPQEAYAPVSANDLDALVAPIALYPDALVAQILGAATYPDQVEAADVFVKSNYNLSGDSLFQAAEDKGWDPSVMALLRFASVLDMMSKNIIWTSALGDAAANQQADVMAAIQRMRGKAYAAGNLKSGEQIKVVHESPNVIVIQPASPQIVYVPTYNPTVVYGTPVSTPGYSTGDVVAASVISFGVGVAVGAMINSSSCGWGYYGWRMNWAGGVVYCGSAPYYGNPYWWGGYYPGYRPGYRPPYYPPPRPPMPPPPGWRPPPPGHRPPYYPPGGSRPPYNPPPGNGRPPSGGRPPNGERPPGNVKPTPLPSQPGRPSIQPVPERPTTRPAQPTVQPKPTTRPSVPGQTNPPTTRELRGYPSTQGPQTAPRPNAFSGSAGGRPESARGNRSLNPPAKPAAPPARAPAPAKTSSAPRKR
jgi:Protein of unknown function (DUF3300)